MSWRLSSIYTFSTWTSLVIHWDFPCGGPVVKIPCFPLQEAGVRFPIGELRSTCLMAKKKKKKKIHCHPLFVGDCKAGVCMKVALNWKSAKCLAIWGRKKDLKDLGQSAVLSPCGKSHYPGDSAGKESACNAGDLGLIPGLGRSPGEGNGYPLQYSGRENSMDRGAWRATVHEGRKESGTTFTHSLHCFIPCLGLRLLQQGLNRTFNVLQKGFQTLEGQDGLPLLPLPSATTGSSWLSKGIGTSLYLVFQR